MKPDSSSRVLFYSILFVGIILSILEIVLDSPSARVCEVTVALAFSLLVAFGLPKTLPNSSSVSNVYKIVNAVLSLFLFASLVSQIILSVLFLRMSNDIDIGMMRLDHDGVRFLSFFSIPLCAGAVAMFTSKEEKRCQIC